MPKEMKSISDEEVEKEIDEIFKDYPSKMNPISVAMCFVVMSIFLGILLHRCVQSL